MSHHILNHNTVTPFESPHGEVVREVGGNAVGGTQDHSVAHITLQPHAASLKHYHPEVEESYYMLTGQARLVMDGESYTLHPGDLVAIRPRQVHQIFNAGDTPITFIAICVPPWTPDCSVFLED